MFHGFRPGYRVTVEQAAMLNQMLEEANRQGQCPQPGASGFQGQQPLPDPSFTPYRLLVRITGVLTSMSGPPQYSWELVDEDAGDGTVSNESPTVTDDSLAWPAYEYSQNPSVPIDGTAVVRLFPGFGGQYFWFAWPHDSSCCTTGTYVDPATLGITPTPVTLTGTQTDYPLPATSWLNVTTATTAPVTFTGLVAPANTYYQYVTNSGPGPVILKNLTTSSAPNQFKDPGGVDLTIPVGGTAVLPYDPTATKWEPVLIVPGAPATIAVLNLAVSQNNLPLPATVKVVQVAPQSAGLSITGITGPQPGQPFNAVNTSTLNTFTLANQSSSSSFGNKIQNVTNADLPVPTKASVQLTNTGVYFLQTTAPSVSTSTGVTGSGTTGYLSIWTGSSALGNSLLDYGVTTGGTFTFAPLTGVNFAFPMGSASLSATGLTMTAGTGEALNVYPGATAQIVQTNGKTLEIDALNAGTTDGILKLQNASGAHVKFSIFAATPVAQQTGDIGAALVAFGFMSGTPAVGASSGGTGIDTSASTGIPSVTAGTWSVAATTGSGSVVLATSPTLVTPALGAATATSLVVAAGTTINGSSVTTTVLAGDNAQLAAAQTVVSGSTSGTATFSQPHQGASYKKIVIFLTALLGTASYTYPTAFAKKPAILTTNGLASTVVTSLGTSSLTVTGAPSTGYLILEGY